jgi:hypothetical protein
MIPSTETLWSQWNPKKPLSFRKKILAITNRSKPVRREETWRDKKLPK